MTKKLNGQSRDVVRDLIKHIQTEGLSAGDRLPSIRQLAARMQVGTTVVRDALVQAQAMGFVRIHPRSGAFVQSLNSAPLIDVLTDTLNTSLMEVDHNLFHLLDTRQLIEMELVGQAAKLRRFEDLLPVQQALETMSHLDEQEEPKEFAEVDSQFHLRIAEITGNRVLVTILKALLDLMPPNLLVRPKTRLMRERTSRSHAEIYQALIQGNAEQARHAMFEHLGMAREMLLAQVQTPLLSVSEDNPREDAASHV